MKARWSFGRFLQILESLFGMTTIHSSAVNLLVSPRSLCCGFRVSTLSWQLCPRVPGNKLTWLIPPLPKELLTLVSQPPCLAKELLTDVPWIQMWNGSWLLASGLSSEEEWDGLAQLSRSHGCCLALGDFRERTRQIVLWVELICSSFGYLSKLVHSGFWQHWRYAGQEAAWSSEQSLGCWAAEEGLPVLPSPS